MLETAARTFEKPKDRAVELTAMISTRILDQVMRSVENAHTEFQSLLSGKSAAGASSFEISMYQDLYRQRLAVCFAHSMVSSETATKIMSQFEIS